MGKTFIEIYNPLFQFIMTVNLFIEEYMDVVYDMNTISRYVIGEDAFEEYLFNKMRFNTILLTIREMKQKIVDNLNDSAYGLNYI